jgi:dipeptidyl aminopeptidase/acylaminoacyl peptidase
MGKSSKVHAHRRAALVFLAAALSVAIIAGSDAFAQDESSPHIVYTVSRSFLDSTVVATDQTGDAVVLSEKAEPFATINSGLVAFARHRRRVTFASDVIIKDAQTGERVYKVVDARWPLLFDGGTSLLFFPDNNGRDVPEDRDQYVSSVWFRDLETGEERRLAQFVGSDLHQLETAVSPDGQQVAFTRGNETFLFVWNIWVASVDGTSLEQITTDDRSLYPSFSPDGQSIAFTYHRPGVPCSASVHLMDVDGSNARRLAAGSCDAVLLRPIWLDATTLVVWRWERTDRGFNRPAGLLTVSSETGEVLAEIATGWVSDFAVARQAGQVVYRLKHGRIVVYDAASDTSFTVPEGRNRPGHVHVDGSLELAI